MGAREFARGCRARCGLAWFDNRSAAISARGFFRQARHRPYTAVEVLDFAQPPKRIVRLNPDRRGTLGKVRVETLESLVVKGLGGGAVEVVLGYAIVLAAALCFLALVIFL